MTLSTKERTKFQRKRVPAALHSELTEYSSLLRTLRTNDTLDLTSQLTRYLSHKGKEKAQIYKDVEDEDDFVEFEDDDYGNVNPAAEVEKTEVGPSRRTNENSVARKRASRSRSSTTEDPVLAEKSSSTHETWTRWPLLAQDVPSPEWTFQDEVAHIASFFLRGTASFPRDLDSDNGSDSDMTPATSEIISSLTLSSSHYLDGILACLATIIPKRPASMINRLAPVGWKSVLAAAQIHASQAGGSVSTKALERVQRRLESLYEPPTSESVEEANSSGPTTSQLQPFSFSAAVPSSLFPNQIFTSSTLPSTSILSHRIHILHASSSKLSNAFSLYGASPSDLHSLDAGYPGIESCLSERWVKDWYADRAREKIESEKQRKKEERKKCREEKECSKTQALEAGTSNKLRRSGRKRKQKQVHFENVSGDANEEREGGKDSDIPKQHENRDSEIDSAPNVDGVQGRGEVLIPKKRKRAGNGGSSGDNGSEHVGPSKKKRKTVVPKSPSPKPETRYKSAESIVDSD
ncbi:hypothetical protein J3R30DRAFT_3417564 [Lentinula aciculospora]|uniref:Rrn9 domain-containing protein n=1 Tax=Lentinula aciculospora TaxID=153920 RepID=A0A9W9AT47_9AGAR|nr:hypothetical protein J3R30DRAFT_3417564 [Lentinula aciculospora]